MNPLFDLPGLAEVSRQALAVLFVMTWKGSLLLAVTGLAVAVLHRSSAATKHFLWTASVLAVLILPVANGIAPRFDVALPTPLQMDLAPATVRVDDPSSRPGEILARAASVREPMTMATPPSRSVSESGAVHIPLSVWIFFAWEFGVLVAFLRWGVQAWRLHRLRRGATRLEDVEWQGLVRRLSTEFGTRPPDVFTSPATRTPLTWGLVHSFVILPRDCRAWPERKRENVLAHEMAHVQRRDCLTQTLAQIVCVMNWFNPLVWIVAGRMRMEREKACDDKVLDRGTRPSSYAETLVDVAASVMEGSRPSPGLSMAGSTRIRERVQAVLDIRADRRSPGRRWGAVLTAMMVMATLSVAALSFATPEPQTSGEPRGGEVREAIAAANEAFMRAFEDQDVDRILSFYSEGAILHMGGGRPLRGIDDIADHYEGVFHDGTFDELRLETDEIEVAGDTAVEMGSFRCRGDWGGSFARGSYMTVWKKFDGKWLVHREMGTLETHRVSNHSHNSHEGHGVR